MQRPMISDIRASFSWPSPSPPSFGSRKAPHRPCALTWSCRWRLTTRHSSAGSWSKIGSSGISSRSMNARIQAELLLELRLGLEVPRHALLLDQRRQEAQAAPLRLRSGSTSGCTRVGPVVVITV